MRNTLNTIGKLALQENTLHNKIFKKAVENATETTKYWKKLLLIVNVTDFNFIRDQCDNDYKKWQSLVKNTINKEIIRNAKQRTIIEKEFPTLKLFWELGQDKYLAKT